MTKTAPTDTTDPYVIRGLKDAPALLARPDFHAFIQKADAFLYDETNWDENCLPPTPHAVQTLFSLLADTAQALFLPSGILYPNGEGGLRLEWRSLAGTDEETYLLLVVHASDTSKDYLYHQQGNLKGKIEVASADHLARLLHTQLPFVK